MKGNLHFAEACAIHDLVSPPQAGFQTFVVPWPFLEMK